MNPARHAPATAVTRRLGPGVRVHALAAPRFHTLWCRVALHRDLGRGATATSLLAAVLEAATARHPTRAQLAQRLADLYGAGLRVATERFGQRQVLAATLDWPRLPGRRGADALREGLALLREVLVDPRIERDGGRRARLAREVVEIERRNLRRALEAARDDKAVYALRKGVEAACPGERFALDTRGRLEDLDAPDARDLLALHGRLLARAPVEIHLAGPFEVGEALEAVRGELRWPRAAAEPWRMPPVFHVRRPSPRPRRRAEHDAVAQTRLVLAWRARLDPRSPLGPAAETLAAVLGGGPFGRLFKVVREEHGLCYAADASWSPAPGMLVVQTGVDPANESRAKRLIHSLAREVMSGRLDPVALAAFRESVSRQVEALRDRPRSLLHWRAAREALGQDPSPDRWLRSLLAVRDEDVARVGRLLGLEAEFALRPRRRSAS